MTEAAFDGSRLGLAWALPFAGLLLSIAWLPAAAPALWHRHFGKVVCGWSLAFLLPFAAAFGPATAAGTLWHTLLADYLPFALLLTALYAVAGGIHIRGNLRGGPASNVAWLASGAALASVMGTTGASMLLIRPLIRANRHRRNPAHVVVFFIFIVSNAGGALTPLGDPPLLIGFLQGVRFFWTLEHLLSETLFLVGALLAIFYAVDCWQMRHERIRDESAADAPPRAAPAPRGTTRPLHVDGAINLLPLAAIGALVLMSGTWRPGTVFDVFGLTLALPALLRDAALLGVIAVTLAITPRHVRAANAFSWTPMREVAALFLGIFVTMAPLLAMLAAPPDGSLFADLKRALAGSHGQPLPAAYFWLTGALSAFLDNAPTYLAFFRFAGGDAQVLMTTHAATLAAISAGAVFMGALTYTGNAPNLMVKAIAEDRGIRMPGFFGYLLWSGAVLLPLFAVMTLIWFR